MKQLLAAILLVGFVGVGIAHVINPRFFLKRSGVHKGGDLLHDWNELGFQIAGAIFAGAAIWGLWLLFRSP